jgi:hypothetical protein
MDTKDQLVNTIREWVTTDNEIRSLQEEIKTRKNKKKQISESLITIMKQNEIDCFDIKDGQICYTKKQIKKPITKGILMNILSKYFEGDLLKANDINTFIMENREETTKESITLKRSL